MADPLIDLLLRRSLPEAPEIDPAEQDRMALEAQAQLPEWKRKAISGLNTGIESILGLVGVGEDTKAKRFGEMVGSIPSTAILPIASPIRNPVWRELKHANLMKDAKRVSGPVAAAMEAWVKKYPRLSAHISHLGKLETGAGRRIDRPVGTGELELPTDLNHDMPTAILRLNPELVNDTAVTRTLTHEGSHLADHVRMTDRARQAGTRAQQRAIAERENVDLSASFPYSTRVDPGGIDAIPTEFLDRGGVLPGEAALDAVRKSDEYQRPMATKYGELMREHGYFNNPMEVRARTNAELQAIPRTTPHRREIAQARAGDKVWQNANMEVNLGREKDLGQAIALEEVKAAAAGEKPRTSRFVVESSGPPKPLYEPAPRKSLFEEGQKLLQRFGTSKSPSVEEVEAFLAGTTHLRNLGQIDLDILNRIKGRLRLMKR